MTNLKTDGKKLELGALDLKQLDLTRKYDADIIEDESPDGVPGHDRILLYTIGIFFVLFVLWANIAKVEEVARGTGQVIPASETSLIQSLEGGIIDKFFVSAGDIVNVNDPLIQIRNIQAQAEYRANYQKYLRLWATVIRLEAQAKNVTPEFPDEIKKEAPDAIVTEMNAFSSKQGQGESQENVLEQQIAQREQEVAENQRRIADISNVIRLAKQEKEMIRPAVEKGAAPKIELLQLDRQIAERQTELNGLQLALPRARAAVEEARQRLKEQQSGSSSDAQRELSEKSIELNAIKETLTAFQDKAERTEIRSQIYGSVKDVKISSVGGVVKPGDVIMEIVPLGDELVVEANVRPQDIAFIYPGQKAVVRLTAFDFSIYGGLEGEVTFISPDSTTNDKGESFYRVKVKTKKTSIKKNGQDHSIIPGMQATVDILTGEKTVMNYILKPFKKASQTALTER
jgi:adhesin transport system membrane fusion protein